MSRHRTSAAADVAQRCPGDVRHAVGARAFCRVLTRGRAQWGVRPSGRVRPKSVRHFRGAFRSPSSFFFFGLIEFICLLFGRLVRLWDVGRSWGITCGRELGAQDVESSLERHTLPRNESLLLRVCFVQVQ
jgi:hypothetical protein